MLLKQLYDIGPCIHSTEAACCIRVKLSPEDNRSILKRQNHPNSFRDSHLHGVTTNLSILYFHHAKLQILIISAMFFPLCGLKWSTLLSVLNGQTKNMVQGFVPVHHPHLDCWDIKEALNQPLVCPSSGYHRHLLLLTHPGRIIGLACVVAFVAKKY